MNDSNSSLLPETQASGCAHSTSAGPELVMEPLSGRDLEAA